MLLKTNTLYAPASKSNGQKRKEKACLHDATAEIDPGQATDVDTSSLAAPEQEEVESTPTNRAYSGEASGPEG